MMVMGIVLMTTLSANAQINLGNLTKGLGQVLGNDLTSIISGKNNVDKETIVGTWSYAEPAVSFESSNMLKQAGGEIVASTIEKKLSKQFTKVGITAGKFLITFTEDGNFSTTKDGRTTTSGTYSISGSKITFSYLAGTASISGYAQMASNKLSLSFDSSKMLDVISKISKYTSGTLSTISSLAGSFDGMKTGLAFTKYVAPVKVAAKTSTAVTSKSAVSTKAKKATKKKTTKKSSKKSKSSKKK
jgi:hypothetical protein